MLLDEFDKAERRGRTRVPAISTRSGASDLSPTSSSGRPTLGGLVGIDLEDTDPIFELDDLDWEVGDEEGTIISLDAGGNQIVAGTANSYFVRWNLRTDQRSSMVLSRRMEDTLYKVFINPSGTDAFATFLSGQSFHIHASATRPSQIGKAPMVIESIGWNESADVSATTQRMLVGTSSGEIFEGQFGAQQSSLQKLYSLPDQFPICGIEIEQLQQVGNSAHAVWVVVVATPTRMYQFIGGPSFSRLFEAYKDTRPSFIELPGDIKRSELHFYRRRGRPKHAAWMNGAGIYQGDINLNRGLNESVIQHSKLMQFPLPPGSSNLQDGNSTPPVQMVSTEFHFILVFPDRVVAVNILNGDIVFDRFFTAGDGAILGVVRDESMHSVFVFSERRVWEMVIDRETRDVWKFFLRENKFMDALEYCGEENRQVVLNAQGDQLFKDGEYTLAAAVYAKADRSFEEIALLFVECDAKNALRSFIRKRLSSLSAKSLTQRTMMCTWLTEIYLDTINSLRDDDDAQEHDETITEFLDFLAEYQLDLDKNTTFDLISSHGRIKELLVYAEMIGDLEWVVNYHFQQSNYDGALQLLSTHDNPQSIEELFYKYSPVLIEHTPQPLVDLLIRSRFLDPSRLLPAFMRYESTRRNAPNVSVEANHAIRYIEYCVFKRGNRDMTVHNYLISLYAKLPTEDALLGFIDMQSDLPLYDPKYALSLCHQEQKHHACVKLYSLMNLFREGVQLALSFDLELAREVASLPGPDHPDRKALWLEIARNVIEKQQDIRKAIDILKDWEGLRIEDILPLFPDDVRLGDFKDEIIASLDSYNERIEELKGEMDDYTQSAALIRQDILQLRNRSCAVGATQQCDLCAEPLLTREVLLFPCTHAMHKDCAVNEVQTRLGLRSSRKNHIAFFDSESDDDDIESFQDLTLNDPIALSTRECALCGDLMIDTLSYPFIAFPDEAELAESWTV